MCSYLGHETIEDENEAKNIANWATFTGFCHKEVAGIWNKFADKTDIVTIDGNEKAGVIAAGDESGLIKLFRFPSENRGAHFRKYVGHSSPICTFIYPSPSFISFYFSSGNVCFLHDTSRLISIGTDDRTIIQWKYLSESDSIALLDARRMSVLPTAARPGMTETLTAEMMDATIEDVQTLQTAHHVGAYLDSDSEDSDSDLSGAEIDSDIEKEKQISYDRTLYREDYKVSEHKQKKKIDRIDEI